VRLDFRGRVLIVSVLGCVLVLFLLTGCAVSPGHLPRPGLFQSLADLLSRPELRNSLRVIVVVLGALVFIGLNLPAETKAAVAIGAWPLLVYLEEGQDVFQWFALIQYAVILYLWWISFVKGKLSGRRLVHLQMAWKFHLAFICVTFLLTLFHSPTLEVGMTSFIKHNLLLPFLYISALTLDWSTARKYVVPVILGTALVVSVFTVVGSFQGVGVIEERIVTSLGTWYRASGPMKNPNQLGTYLGSVLAFALVYLFASVRGYRYLPVWAILVVLMGLAVILSFSRRVFITLPLSLCIAVGLLRDWRSRILLILVIAAVLVLMTQSNWDQVVLQRLVATFWRGGMSLRQGQLWRLWQRLDSPGKWAIGLGPGASGLASRMALPESIRASMELSSVDGYYWSLLAEYGLVAMIVYLCLVASVLSRIVKAIIARRLTAQAHTTAVACLAGMLVILLSGLVGNANYSFPGAMYLWVFAGLAIVAITEGTEATDPFPEPAPDEQVLKRSSFRTYWIRGVVRNERPATDLRPSPRLRAKGSTPASGGVNSHGRTLQRV